MYVASGKSHMYIYVHIVPGNPELSGNSIHRDYSLSQ